MIGVFTILHGGLTFGPLSPPSRDGICMPKQVWSTFFLFEIFDHMINSLRIRRFGPYSNSSNMQVWSTSNRKSGPNLRIRTDLMPRDHKLFEFAGLVHFFCSNWTKLAYSKSLNMDQTCVFDENLSRDQKFRRESQWTKLVTACICCHVMEEVVDQTWKFIQDYLCL